MKALYTTIVICLTAYGGLFSQPRANYPMLHRMNQDPSTFIGKSFFPTDSGLTQTIFSFKIGYDQLTFLRDQSSTGETFSSHVELIIDMYDKETAEIPDRAFIERRTWTSKVTAKSFEETLNPTQYVEGLLKFELKPDRYRYIATIHVNGQSRLLTSSGNQTQINGMLSSANRRSNQRNRNLRQFVDIPDLTDTYEFSTISLIKDSPSDSLIIYNTGSNVPFSEDYKVLVGIHTSRESNYMMEVLNIGNRPAPDISTDSTAFQIVFSKELNQSTSISSSSGLYLANGNLISLLNESNITYHLISVPNSKFPNSWYQIRVVDPASEQKTIASSNILSRWYNIPSSLLNLDIALDHMRFILDESQLKEMRRGSDVEKEQKFRFFWQQRDPTPDSDYNELMTEYFTRIDQAFEKYTTPSKPGHESDQGKIFIVYGPPDTIERRFPPSGNTQEIWTYENRTFIFTASSGFGDFRLTTQ